MSLHSKLNAHTYLFSTNEVSREDCREGIHQGVGSTLLLISLLPFILHSGKQCHPVTADQDWAGEQWGTSQG